ncbi:MAG: hypothetical protein PVF58_10310 [Candidatus Methanofastidiosia archaeon]
MDDNLLEYLIPKLTRKSIETHKNLGFKAREYLESILDKNLTVTFGREVFDRYGRPLVYVGNGQENTLGIWGDIDDILIPMELRYLTRRELPEKYCADLETGVLYPPEMYYMVPVVNRLFFYPKDVALAVCMGFNPVRECDSWLHKIWRGLHPGSKRRREGPEIPEKIPRGK